MNERNNDSENQKDPWQKPANEVFLADLTGNLNADRLLEGVVDRDTGMGRVLERLQSASLGGTDVTGGDWDDDWYQAEVVGEEAVGGQNPTPDQNVTELLLESMGIAAADGGQVHTQDILLQRDRARWELDPSSAEDYSERYD